jgi:hypothetical protein
MGYRVVNTVSIRATDQEVAVGPVLLPAGDCLRVRLRQLSPLESSVFCFGLVYVRTTTGRIYGTKRFWGHLEGETYVLGGDCYVPDAEVAMLWVNPRGINRRILRQQKTPVPWVLEVSVDDFRDVPPPSLKSSGFVNRAGRLLSLIRAGTTGRLRF